MLNVEIERAEKLLALRDAISNLEKFEAQIENIRFIKSFNVLHVEYSKIRDGGDASITGDLYLDITKSDIEFLIKRKKERMKEYINTLSEELEITIMEEK